MKPLNKTKKYWLATLPVCLVLSSSVQPLRADPPPVLSPLLMTTPVPGVCNPDLLVLNAIVALQQAKAKATAIHTFGVETVITHATTLIGQMWNFSPDAYGLDATKLTAANQKTARDMMWNKASFKALWSGPQPFGFSPIGPVSLINRFSVEYAQVLGNIKQLTTAVQNNGLFYYNEPAHQIELLNAIQVIDNEIAFLITILNAIKATDQDVRDNVKPSIEVAIHLMALINGDAGVAGDPVSDMSMPNAVAFEDLSVILAKLDNALHSCPPNMIH